MPEPEDDVERIIEAAIRRHSAGAAAMLRHAILESLWTAGYDVTRRPDMIPIRRNPGRDAASSLYTAEQERQAQGLTPAELFHRLADEPRNAQIAEEIRKIADRLPKGIQDAK